MYAPPACLLDEALIMQGNPEECILQVNCPEKRFWHAHAGTFLAETEGL